MGSVVVAYGLSDPEERGIFPDQGLNLCLLHRQADSLPLSHQGSPFHLLLTTDLFQGKIHFCHLCFPISPRPPNLFSLAFPPAPHVPHRVLAPRSHTLLWAVSSAGLPSSGHTLLLRPSRAAAQGSLLCSVPCTLSPSGVYRVSPSSLRMASGFLSPAQTHTEPQSCLSSHLMNSFTCIFIFKYLFTLAMPRGTFNLLLQHMGSLVAVCGI